MLLWKRITATQPPDGVSRADAAIRMPAQVVRVSRR
jgi:hypothetical protein